MKVLVVGSGGREHAICWKLSKSPKVDKIYCAPGNAGIAELAECVDIKAMEFDKLVAFAKENSIDLTVIGMDDPRSILRLLSILSFLRLTDLHSAKAFLYVRTKRMHLQVLMSLCLTRSSEQQVIQLSLRNS